MLDACLDRFERARELPWTAPNGRVPGAGAPPRGGVAIELVHAAARHARRRRRSRLQLSGECVLSTTRIDDRVVLRAAIVNHRTTDADLELTVAAVAREARAID